MPAARLSLSDDPIVAPVDIARIQAGDIMTFTYRARVTRGAQPGTNVSQISLVNVDTNAPFDIRGADLIAAGLSADYFATEVSASLTKVAEIFIASKKVPFTVVFTKQNGELRTLRGWMLRANSALGQSLVQDLDLPPDDNQRTVEHKQIKFLIVEGTKYVVS